MAGMLPGVESARRRRIHQTTTAAIGLVASPSSSRRASFSLFSTNSPPTSLNQQRSRGHHQVVVVDDKLGHLARQAKERLDERLRAQRKSPFITTRSNSDLSQVNHRNQRPVANVGDLTREVYGSKKHGKKVNKLGWKAGEQQECSVCLDEFKDSITSICKSILPFSLKKKPSLTAAERKHSDNLKWQQNSFHHILNLIGLHKQGLVPASEVASFRRLLLDTLIAPHSQQPLLLRDNLLFLQELLHAKCISEEEYHASKRPLLHRLAVQGAELEATDVIVYLQNDCSNQEHQEEEEEEWSTIDLRDDHSSIKTGVSSSKNKSKNGTSSAIKHIKDKASVFGFGSFQKLGKHPRQKSIFDNVDISGKQNVQPDDNPFFSDHQKEIDNETEFVFGSDDVLGCQGRYKDKNSMLEGFGTQGIRGVHCGDDKSKESDQKIGWKKWGFDGLKRWKRTNREDETTPLPLGDKSKVYQKNSCELGASPDTKRAKNQLLFNSPPASFIIDKVLRDRIKEELSLIQSEMSSTNQNLLLSDDQMDTICRKLPVDESDLRQLFPKSWCKQYGKLVLDVVKRQVKEHIEENECMRNATLERRQISSKRWTTMDDEENCHPNLFAAQNNNKKSAFCPDQNPFWNGYHIQDK